MTNMNTQEMSLILDGANNECTQVAPDALAAARTRLELAKDAYDAQAYFAIGCSAVANECTEDGQPTAEQQFTKACEEKSAALRAYDEAIAEALFPKKSVGRSHTVGSVIPKPVY